MCEHRPNEPWWAYIARWVVEQPRVLLSVIGIVAAGIFYYDLRSYMNFQQQVQTETVRVLNDLSLRLNAVERHLERLDKAGESTNYQPPGQGSPSIPGGRSAEPGIRTTPATRNFFGF